MIAWKATRLYAEVDGVLLDVWYSAKDEEWLWMAAGPWARGTESGAASSMEAAQEAAEAYMAKMLRPTMDADDPSTWIVAYSEADGGSGTCRMCGGLGVEDGAPCLDCTPLCMKWGS